MNVFISRRHVQTFYRFWWILPHYPMGFTLWQSLKTPHWKQSHYSPLYRNGKYHLPLSKYILHRHVSKQSLDLQSDSSQFLNRDAGVGDYAHIINTSPLLGISFRMKNWAFCLFYYASSMSLADGTFLWYIVGIF